MIKKIIKFPKKGSLKNPKNIDNILKNKPPNISAIIFEKKDGFYTISFNII